ncbi:phosphoenolpyruvate carboxylase [Candidatus Micrarchaeota archaeon]|nr:phosphoenolpyruvate carboxylase [Candidatus Micrarchaeota archaeon]
MKKIPRCMSTQHPDNVATPFFSDSEVLAREAEVKEAFFVFSQLGCNEQMWDSEGKEVDNQVVEKLLSRYPDFFARHPLGREFSLTYRVPNPSVEKEQGKILLETMYSIPRAYDVARAAGFKTAPVFEVILPMTTSHQELDRVKNYYEQVVVGQKDVKLGSEKITVKKWVGDFRPERVNVIPLFENYDSLAGCGSIVAKFLKKNREIEYQRVFLARSDPALNYGSASAVLLSKVALRRLYAVQENTGIPIYPILGVGGSPFRGNFTPENVNNCGEEYPSVQTFTVQSSFKYDYPFRDVVNAIDMINHRHRRPPLEIDEEKALSLVRKIARGYEGQLKQLADTINGISAFVPSRRARKLHVGLFGYSRSMKGISLPRAIKFCASFYSIGLPPELLGLSALSEKEFDGLHEHYVKLDEDLRGASRFLNRVNLGRMPKKVREGVYKVLDWIDYEEDPQYAQITTSILDDYRAGRHSNLAEGIKSAAWKRGFLG